MTLRPHDHRGPPRSGPGGGGGAERSDAAPPQPGPERGKWPPDRLRRSWTREFKAALVEAWLASGEPAQRFAAKHGIQGIQLVRWRDAASRPSAPRKGRPRPARRPHRPAAVRPVFSPEEKRAAVEGLQKTELTHSVFAKLFGITARTLQTWVARYKAGGPKALEPKRRGRPKGSGRKPTPPAVAEAIVTTKRRCRRSHGKRDGERLGRRRRCQRGECGGSEPGARRERRCRRRSEFHCGCRRKRECAGWQRRPRPRSRSHVGQRRKRDKLRRFVALDQRRGRAGRRNRWRAIG